MANKGANLTAKLPLGRRLWWLISGRAAGVILLLMIGVVWKWTAQGPGFNSSLHAATPSFSRP